MTVVTFVLACLAGGAGAVLRYLVDAGVAKLAKGRFPWGIVLVNITGSFALGVVAAFIPDQEFILGMGLLGGYTTFSTAMLDALALWQDEARGTAVLHLLGTFAAAVVAAAAGLALGGLM